MEEDYSEEKELIREKFETLLESIAIDPTFEFKVENIEVFKRQSITGATSRVAFAIEVQTNNRIQLLGQMEPYDTTSQSGHFERMCQGRIVEELEHELNPDYPFTIDINAVPEDSITKYPDRCLPLSKAINEGLVPEESPLAEMMRKYNLRNIVLARGSSISGPSAGAMKTMEQVYESKDIETVLELFAGSGAYSKIATAHGAKHVDIIDLDGEPAKGNLADTPEVNIQEKDVFDFMPERDYDLIIADPNSEIAKRFVNEKVPELIKHCEYYFQNVAFVGHTYWRETITAELEPYFEDFTEYNTGRIHQILGQT